MKAVREFLLIWRTMVVRDREIIDALVHPDHVGPSPALKAALDDWQGAHYWADGDGTGRLVLIRSLVPAPKERWWLHIGLLLLSFLTVWMGGALLSGAAVPQSTGIFGFPLDGRAMVQWIGQLRAGNGLDFAIALIVILLAHEMGHYVLGRRYHINASPPYFIPAPPFLNFIGTFGAFIRIRGQIRDRKRLFDVGIAGPIAGFVALVPFLLIGIARSSPGVVHLATSPGTADAILYRPGSNLAMILLTRLFHGQTVPASTLDLHPFALAAWVGLLATALNLMPLGQLDGGHILYAVSRRGHRVLAWPIWLGLIVLGWTWQGWLLWGGLVLLMGLRHPPVTDPTPLDPRRRRLALLAPLILVLCFTPKPLAYLLVQDPPALLADQSAAPPILRSDVQDESHGAIVCQLDLHHSAKPALTDFVPARPQPTDEVGNQLSRNAGRRRLREGWPSALFETAGERELGHDEEGTPCLRRVTIHPSLPVREDPHLG